MILDALANFPQLWDLAMNDANVSKLVTNEFAGMIHPGSSIYLSDNFISLIEPNAFNG